MPRTYRILLILTALVAITAMAIPGGVVIEGRLIEPAKAGETTPMTISVSKGGLDYFGRMMLHIPEDCRLEPSVLFGGSYHWDESEHVAVISWLKLPDPERFNLEFKLSVAPEAPPGPREVDWEFSFIRNNDRATVHPAPFIFYVLDTDGHVGQSSTSATQAKKTTGQTGQTPSPSATRSTALIGNDTRVTLNLAHVPEGGFVKIIEHVSPGCSCQILDAAGGVAQVNGSELSIMWFDYANLGSVTYQMDNCRLSHPQNFKGTLSCVIEDASKSFDVIQELLREKEDPEPLVEPQQPLDVAFEIQIAATKKPVVTDYFERKLNFRFSTREEQSKHWVKYTYERFDRYEEARDHRNELTKAYAFHGPFVVARKGEHRISVQEALTLTRQSWLP